MTIENVELRDVWGKACKLRGLLDAADCLVDYMLETGEPPQAQLQSGLSETVMTARGLALELEDEIDGLCVKARTRAAHRD